MTSKQEWSKLVDAYGNFRRWFRSEKFEEGRRNIFSQHKIHSLSVYYSFSKTLTTEYCEKDDKPINIENKYTRKLALYKSKYNI